MDQHTDNSAVNIALGIGGLSSHWWLQFINETAQTICLVGGAITFLYGGWCFVSRRYKAYRRNKAGVE